MVELFVSPSTFNEDSIKRGVCDLTGYDVYDGWLQVESAPENFRSGKFLEEMHKLMYYDQRSGRY